MRLIGSIDRREHAERFVAFLKTQDIAAHLDQEDSQFELWIKDEDSVSQAVTLLNEFRGNPDEPKYLRAKGLALELLKKEEQRRIQIQKNVVKVNAGSSQKKKPPLTMLLIGLSVLVCLLTNFGHRDSREGSVFRALSFAAIERQSAEELLLENEGDRDAMGIRLASINRGEAWRLITPIFIHFGIFHLAFNMIWMFQLGTVIENRCGTVFFALLVVAAAVVPNFLQGVVPDRVGGSVPGIETNYMLATFGGMSGVVYGLFGFMWMKTLFDPAAGMRLPESTVIIMIGWLFFCMTPMAAEWFDLNVANWAHAIGLIVGIVAGIMPIRFAGGTTRAR